MKRLLLLLFKERECVCVCAQNLVPNGNFEQYSVCPTGNGQVYSTLFWFNPTMVTTSDYYNQCSDSIEVDVPNNSCGFQQAHSGGAYCGIFLLQKPGLNARDYIEVALTTPLLSNVCYHFEMYVNLVNYCSAYTTDAIGVYFSDSAISDSNYTYPFLFIPKISNTSGVFDTLNWTLVSGNYTATGGEKYLTIGNFKNDANTYDTLINISAYNNGFLYAYVYVDDVSLTLCDTTAIEELQITDYRLQIYPNPNNGNMQLDYQIEHGQVGTLLIHDIVGRKIETYSLQNDRNTLKVSDAALKNGIYFYEILIDGKIVRFDKLIIIR